MFISRKTLILGMVALLGLLMSGTLFADDPQLAASSTLEDILQRGKILVGSDFPYAPFEFEDDNGNLVGLDVDLIKMLAKQMDVEYEFVASAFDPIIANLNAGNFDLIASDITANLSRGLAANFTDAYLKTGQIVMLSTSKAPGKDVTSYNQLNSAGVIITVQLGTTGESAARNFFPKAEIRTFSDANAALQEVVDGRADAIVFDDVFLKPQQDVVGSKGVLCCPRGNPTVLTNEPIALAIRKGDPDFLHYLNFYIQEAGTNIRVTEEIATEFSLDADLVGLSFLEAIRVQWLERFEGE